MLASKISLGLIPSVIRPRFGYGRRSAARGLDLLEPVVLEAHRELALPPAEAKAICDALPRPTIPELARELARRGTPAGQPSHSRA
jgi:hypothetical protein